MEGKPRRDATAQEALDAMDRMVALALVSQHDIAQRLGLNVTDLTCLGHVIGAGQRHLTAGDLAQHANVTTGAITGVINRLERAGYVSRQPDPADRRRVRVVLDENAAARVFAVYGPHYRRLADLAGDYTPQETAVLADWFTRARQAMEESLDEIRKPSSSAGPGGPRG
ncbi:MarR family transcriptional regulator [Streptomyces sp. E2N166]|uniref:MarR family winged helix-turn-helix transcriptional regulator n=1 Tax=Streptomyces sp. E2N166 TaxID=1851909 RepID=UPI000EF6728B|nr:MarR family transcriptional regulator [Streptomyces sp. E2N166]